MKTIEELQSELRSIAAELEQLKEQCTDKELTADLAQISANASRYPIEPHPLAEADAHEKKCYITLLLTTSSFEPDRLSESLLLAHRIAFGCGYLDSGDLREEFTSAQILTFEQLDEITRLFKDSELRLMLILECLLTAGSFGRGRQKAFEYIAQLAVLLNVSKDELTFLSNMAAVILTNDLKNYKCRIANQYEIFGCYLKSLKFDRRIIVADIPRELDNINSDYKYFLLCNNVKFSNSKLSYECEYTDSLGMELFKLLQFGFVWDYESRKHVIEQSVSDEFYLLETYIKPGKPVGVETHYLDSKTEAQKFFDSMKNTEEEK